MITRRNLRNWSKSEYEQLVFYINERKCDVGGTSYIYSCGDKKLREAKIVHIICWSDDADYYDNLIRDDYILLKGETEYKADASAEFITDNDSYLVWFKYV